MALLFGHWRARDLLHFTIYACIFLPLAGLLYIYTCAIYLIRFACFIYAWAPFPVSNFFLQIYKYSVGCICGTKWTKVVRVVYVYRTEETERHHPSNSNLSNLSPCHVY